MVGAVAKISVTADVSLAGSDEVKGQLHYTLAVGPDAQADVTWSLDWKAAAATAMEAGLKFLLPAATDRMSWLSENLWTDYPADHIGNPHGTATSKDISFRSSKRNVHWITLSGSGKFALVALAEEEPLHARGRVEGNGTMLFLNSAFGVMRDFSSSATPGHDISLAAGKPLEARSGSVLPQTNPSRKNANDTPPELPGRRLRGACPDKRRRAGQAPTNTAPHLEKHGTATQLIVDGKPFLALAGELSNSSASSPAYMKPIWPRLVATHFNTVLATVSWELIEPEEGRFDFTLVDDLLKDARQSNIAPVLLWFGSWKNGKSTYQPLWVKLNQAKYPLVQNEEGHGLPTLSTFSETNREADARAFAALMRHLREADGSKHTVIMVQVENEVGVLDTPRDFCPAANQAFNGPVPKQLMDYLQAHKDKLVPQLREAWGRTGLKTSGTWEEVFGKSTVNKQDWHAFSYLTEEIFMAWNYALRRPRGRRGQGGVQHPDVRQHLDQAGQFRLARRVSQRRRRSRRSSTSGKPARRPSTFFLPTSTPRISATGAAGTSRPATHCSCPSRRAMPAGRPRPCGPSAGTTPSATRPSGSIAARAPTAPWAGPTT